MPPINLEDISLWLATTSIILLITVELLSPNYGRINILIDRRKFKNVSYVLSILFLITVIIYLT
jgi:hypothetical protein